MQILVFEKQFNRDVPFKGCYIYAVHCGKENKLVWP